ncbi:MAG TPA: hypothetical protein VII78_10430 [Myxococcota bacterium]
MGRRVLAVGLALVLGACGAAPADDPDETADSPAAGDATVSVSADVASTFSTALAEAAEAPAQVSAPARVLDAAALVDVAGALANATVAAEAAAGELRRTRTLARDHENASERELAAAQLAEAQARGALAAAQARALASFGTRDAARIARLADALARGELAVARIELPAGVGAPGPGDEILVSAPALGDEARPARLIGAAGALEPSIQGRAVLVSLGPNPPPSGAALEATLASGAPLQGVWLPASAILWSDGVATAFVATSATTFVPRTLELARPLRDGYLASAGVSAGERVVTSGAQQLLSATRVGGEPEED